MSEEHLIASTVKTLCRGMRYPNCDIRALFMISINLILATRGYPAGPRAVPQDTTGARRMPWHREPMKDAASCDNPRRGAHILRPGGLRMGEPMHSSVHIPGPNT